MNKSALLLISLLVLLDESSFSQIFTWEEMASFGGHAVNMLAVGPADEIYAAVSDSGVYKTTNNGETWIRTAALDTSDADQTAYSVFVHETGIVLAWHEAELFRSTNQGSSWEKVVGMVGNFETFVSDSSGNIYTAGNSIYKSTDAGLTWEFSGVGAHGGHSLARSENDYLFLGGASEGVLRSTNHGLLWEQTVITTGDVRGIATDSGGVVYAATDGLGIWKSTDFGVNWDITGTGLDGYYKPIVVTPDRWVLSGSYYRPPYGAFLSTNQGTSWQEVSDGFVTTEDSAVQTLVLVPEGYVFAGCSSGKVYRSSIPVRLPDQVTLLAPANGAVLTADSVRAVWNQAEPAVYYYYAEFAFDSLFTDSVLIAVSPTTSVLYRPLANNQTYWWRVAAYNAFGLGQYSDPWSFSVLITGIAEEVGVPESYSLSQNYPNPFNPTTTIKYGLPQKARVKLEIFNVLGQSIAVLTDGEQEPGYHSVTLESSRLASGLYLYRLQAGDFVETKKLIILR